MFSLLKTKKSAGVRVTANVHRLIKQANTARDRGEWDQAADIFRQAVTADPMLAHIWVQLGHAEKERKRYGDAEAAYARAAIAAPEDAESLLHLAHMQKRLGNVPATARAFLRAARLNPTDPRVLEELQQFIAGTTAYSRPDLITLLRMEVFGEGDGSSVPASPSLLLDISSLAMAALAGRGFDSLALVGHRIAPELIAADPSIGLCAHVVGHGRWIAVSPAQFKRILTLGLGADAMGPLERQNAITDLDLSFVLSRTLDIRPGAVLAGLDPAQAPIDHALFVCAARDAGARYIAFDQPDAASTADAVRAAVAGPIEAPPAMPARLARAARIERLSDGAFRTGTGWLPPEDWGCWATMPGGELEIGMPPLDHPRLYLRLRALPGTSVQFRYVLSDGRRMMGEIEAGAHKWVVIDDLPVTDAVLRLAVSAETNKLVRVQGSNRSLPAMIGVAGFYLCERDDHAARTALLETTLLGDLEALA